MNGTCFIVETMTIIPYFRRIDNLPSQEEKTLLFTHTLFQ